MLGLPRKLTVDELAELFGGRTRFVELLAQEEDPLARAEERKKWKAIHKSVAIHMRSKYGES